MWNGLENEEFLFKNQECGKGLMYVRNLITDVMKQFTACSQVILNLTEF